MIKILVVALNKPYVIIVANDKRILDEIFFDEIHSHPLIGHICIVTCD